MSGLCSGNKRSTDWFYLSSSLLSAENYRPHNTFDRNETVCAIAVLCIFSVFVQLWCVQWANTNAKESQHQRCCWKTIHTLIYCLSSLVITSPARAVAKYCDEHVCVCLFVCLSARISPEPHARSFPNLGHVAYHGHASVLIQWGDEMPMEEAILGVFFPIGNALYGPYRGINFTTKTYLA